MTGIIGFSSVNTLSLMVRAVHETQIPTELKNQRNSAKVAGTGGRESRRYMVTGKEDLLQALIEAFAMEKGTKLFYADAAEKANTPLAKNTFEELSGWEEQHMDFILFLYQAIHGDRDITTFQEFRERSEAPLVEGGMSIEDLQSRMERLTAPDESAALKLAMEIEGRAYALYRRLSENSEDANARVVFREMMEQEVQHINHLKTLKQKLPGTGE